jgi:DNA primase
VLRVREGLSVLTRNDAEVGYDFELIRSTYPIEVFFAGRGVDLKRMNGYSVARCPFHNEQHGMSLSVMPGQQRWRCHGQCDRGGDVIDALELLERIPREVCHPPVG